MDSGNNRRGLDTASDLDGGVEIRTPSVIWSAMVRFYHPCFKLSYPVPILGTRKGLRMRESFLYGGLWSAPEVAKKPHHSFFPGAETPVFFGFLVVEIRLGAADIRHDGLL